MLGLQAGYEGKPQAFGPSEWALKPAAELEGLYIGQQSPVRDRPITPGVLGTQDVTLRMTVGVVLANAVLTVQTPWSSRIIPYFGVGAGVARLSIQGANSTNPSEPGINHFDSGPDASATAFALQFKAGLKGEVARNLLLFAEYRHLTLNPTQYTFGETLPPHLPTDSWTVSLGDPPPRSVELACFRKRRFYLVVPVDRRSGKVENRLEWVAEDTAIEDLPESPGPIRQLMPDEGVHLSCRMQRKFATSSCRIRAIASP